MKLLHRLTYAAAVFACLAASAQSPIYIVNGRQTADIRDIPPADIESVEALEIDDESIARYGTDASHGVIIVTLKYDEPAQFAADTLSFNNYIARCVEWGDNEPAARVAMRYTVGEDGRVTLGEVLESTDNRLRRRVVAAVAEAPAWKPAMKNGKAVASEHVLSLQLPRGKELPREPYVVLW